MHTTTRCRCCVRPPCLALGRLSYSTPFSLRSTVLQNRHTSTHTLFPLEPPSLPSPALLYFSGLTAPLLVSFLAGADAAGGRPCCGGPRARAAAARVARALIIRNAASPRALLQYTHTHAAATPLFLYMYLFSLRNPPLRARADGSLAPLINILFFVCGSALASKTPSFCPPPQPRRPVPRALSCASLPPCTPPPAGPPRCAAPPAARKFAAAGG